MNLIIGLSELRAHSPGTVVMIPVLPMDYVPVGNTAHRGRCCSPGNTLPPFISALALKFSLSKPKADCPPSWKASWWKKPVWASSWSFLPIWHLIMSYFQSSSSSSLYVTIEIGREEWGFYYPSFYFLQPGLLSYLLVLFQSFQEHFSISPHHPIPSTLSIRSTISFYSIFIRNLCCESMWRTRSTLWHWMCLLHECVCYIPPWRALFAPVCHLK